jgi:predicted nucleic acid-binding protein
VARRGVVRGGTLVLDSEGLSKLSRGHRKAHMHYEGARRRGARVIVSALTLTEVLRGGSRDAAIHLVLSRISVHPVTVDLGRAAGELLGATGLSGHRCAIDAVVAATTLRADRPALLLTSDPDDLNKLVEEPARPKHERIVVVHV